MVPQCLALSKRLPLSLINLVNWKYPFYGRDPIYKYILLLRCRRGQLSPIGRLPSGISSVSRETAYFPSLRTYQEQQSDVTKQVLQLTHYSTAVRCDKAGASAETDDMNTGQSFSFSRAGLVSLNALLCYRQFFIMCRTGVLTALLRCRHGQMSTNGKQP